MPALSDQLDDFGCFISRVHIPVHGILDPDTGKCTEEPADRAVQHVGDCIGRGEGEIRNIAYRYGIDARAIGDQADRTDEEGEYDDFGESLAIGRSCRSQSRWKQRYRQGQPEHGSIDKDQHEEDPYSV